MLNAENLQSIKENLNDLFIERPKLRNETKKYEICWEYWKKYDGLLWGLTKEMWINQGKGITKYTALERVLRDIFKGKNDLKQGEIFRETYAKTIN